MWNSCISVLQYVATWGDMEELFWSLTVTTGLCNWHFVHWYNSDRVQQAFKHVKTRVWWKSAGTSAKPLDKWICCSNCNIQFLPIKHFMIEIMLCNLCVWPSLCSSPISPKLVNQSCLGFDHTIVLPVPGCWWTQVSVLWSIQVIDSNSSPRRDS